MLSTRSLSADAKTKLKKLIQPKIPGDLERNFRSLSDHGLKELEKSLVRNGLPDEATASMPSLATEYRRGTLAHLHRRLDIFRATVIPWLADAKPLTGAKILEIGCGTGSSTVALAEQGADVVGIDIDEGNLQAARDRCRLYGVDATFLNLNASEVSDALAGRRFDIVIFFACLEHMTHEERICAMQGTWNMLRPGDLWCVIEAPNRLWYFDQHTSHLPFYSWLPNDLAFDYSRFSLRESFRDRYRRHSAESMLAFLRRGRGVSFHEFDIAMGPVEQLDVVSSRGIWLRQKSFLRLWDMGWRVTFDRRFERCLASIRPEVHPGFYQPFLDLIIRKHQPAADEVAESEPRTVSVRASFRARRRRRPSTV